MKIAILTKGFDGWSGGMDYLVNLISTISAQSNAKRPLLIDVYVARNNFTYFLKVLLYPVLIFLRTIARGEFAVPKRLGLLDEREQRQRLKGIKGIRVLSPAHSRSRLLAAIYKENYDIIFPCDARPNNHPRPVAISYWHDFQFKYFPDYFTNQDTRFLEDKLKDLIDCNVPLLVNSVSVKHDFRKYYPTAKNDILVMKFAPSPVSLVENDRHNIQKLCSEYGISRNYFVICNQLWRHKNHITAIRAFSNFVKAHDKDVSLVMTGELADFRFPKYYGEVVQIIKELGIKDNVHMLGYIPKNHQLILLKNAVACVQPTLFEGGPGGGVAPESIALGTPLLLSDIAVNREVVEAVPEADVRFFNPLDDQSLSFLMRSAFDRKDELLNDLSDILNKNKEYAGKLFIQDLATLIDR